MFASELSSGRTNIVQHRINTGDAQPIRQAPRRLPLAKQEKSEELVRKMLDEGVIEESNSYPLPQIDDTFTTLSGSAWFSTLDLKIGYWQVGIHPEDKEKTAFSAGSGLHQFTVMASV